MVQNIDIKFQEKAKSQPLNKRFKDITGQCVLTGFRLQKGTTDFSVNLMRGGFNSGIAISPSGAKVEETTDLLDRLAVKPNVDIAGAARVDSVYLMYSFGTPEAVATYIVVEGTNIPAENPNKLTHLLLGYIYVQPNSQPLRTGDFISVPYGFANLEIAGKSLFHGEVNFEKKVEFKGEVIFSGGSSSGDSNASFVERFPTPIIAAPGQQSFTLPNSMTYVMGTQTLFVFKNGELQPPSEWQEFDNKTFRFFDPLVGGEEIWAFWYKKVSVYTPGDHNHDNLYYRKWEIANRAVRYATDFFSGPSGRIVRHFLGNQNYIVISVIPVEKGVNVGEITTDKRDDEIVVYNSGTYKGKFDLTYMVKAPYDDANPYGEWEPDLNVSSGSYDATNKVYTVTDYKRKDGTLYMKSTLLNINANGRYTRVKVDYYNTTGTMVISTKMWALNYDTQGKVTSKTQIV